MPSVGIGSCGSYPSPYIVLSVVWPISFNNPCAFAFRLGGRHKNGWCRRSIRRPRFRGILCGRAVICLAFGAMTFRPNRRVTVFPKAMTSPLCKTVRLPGSAAIVIAVLCFAALSGYSCPAARGQRDSINSTPSKQKLLLSVGQGSRALQQGDNAAAETAFRQAYRLAPQSVEVLNDLAISIARQGREDEAIALYERALRLKPGDVITRRNLGVAYFRAHRYKSALPLLESFSRSTPNFSVA